MFKMLAYTLALTASLNAFAAGKAIQTTEAPAAIGPYWQAIHTGELLYISGQIPIDPKTGTMVVQYGDIQKQTQIVLNNIDVILKAAGCEKTDVVKTTVFLTKMSDFDAMNEVYSKFFGDHKPARSTIGVAALPKNSNVEIETIASCKNEIRK
jgi:2-iminobutanoate/2-iminopropanoate deaminase